MSVTCWGHPLGWGEREARGRVLRSTHRMASGSVGASGTPRGPPVVGRTFPSKHEIPKVMLQL